MVGGAFDSGAVVVATMVGAGDAGTGSWDRSLGGDDDRAVEYSSHRCVSAPVTAKEKPVSEVKKRRSCCLTVIILIVVALALLIGLWCRLKLAERGYHHYGFHSGASRDVQLTAVRVSPERGNQCVGNRCGRPRGNQSAPVGMDWSLRCGLSGAGIVLEPSFWWDGRVPVQGQGDP